VLTFTAIAIQQGSPVPEGQEPLLSVIVPARNESGLIARSLVRLAEVLSRLDVPYEIIVSDSASIDHTARIVESQALPFVKLVRNDLPGKGRALTAGMRIARGQYLGFIDADLEIDPNFIVPLFDALRAGADFAISVKTLPDPRRSRLRRAATLCYNAIIRRLLGTPFSDHQGGLKLFRGDLIRPLLPRLMSEGWFWDTEMLFALHRAGARGAEVGVHTIRHRTSQVSFWRVSFELLIEGVRLRLARRHPRVRERAHPVVEAR
jgi:glycosyltransferase involved in cell wall biosynthesis